MRMARLNDAYQKALDRLLGDLQSGGHMAR